jgi:hypothetical protein
MNMIKISLKNPETFYRVEESSEKCSYGCEQEWYHSDWQKRSGCGPTTACNLMSYMEFSSLSKQKQISISKEYGLLRMQESWKYVTPAEKGIPTTKMFSDNFLNYAKAKDMNVSCHSLNISQKINSRPEFHDIVKFIEAAMLKDSPVAFLNLCNGEVSNLDEWHWVTIISIEYDESETEVNVNIIDEGSIKKIDLKLWNDTTTLGGGFVYFEAV